VRMSRYWLAISIFAALFSWPVLARPQSFDLTNGRVPMTPLDGLWRFHTGDDPAWADPNFDDTQWSLLRSDAGWSSQGYKNYGGMAWYRFQVIVPAGLDRISLYLPRLHTCYQVYADGSLIGTYGKMPPNKTAYAGGGDYQVYPLPAGKRSGRKIEIAIRVWHWPGWATYYSGGPVTGGGLVGDSGQIDQLDALRRRTCIGNSPVTKPLHFCRCWRGLEHWLCLRCGTRKKSTCGSVLRCC
jgi:sigma-B regulation protein RsbU (phosphoserine phosphatase)